MSTMQTAMMTMFEHAKASMSAEDLEPLASLTDHAADEARRLSAVCEGLGCLVSCDGESGAGNFQNGGDVSTLLFALAHSFDTIAAMVQAGNEATHELSKRQRSEGQEVKQ